MKFCGIYASDHRHMKCAVAAACPVCLTPEERTRGRVGLGYYSGDEVLLMRRPVGPDMGVQQLLGPAMGNHVLVGFEEGLASQFRLENTPPLRFRNYLGLLSIGPVRCKDFASRLLFHVPDYLARDIRTDTPADLLFHLFLSYVHDLGRIDAKTMPAPLLMDAVRSTILLLPKLLDAPAPPPVALCVTNGQHMVAVAYGTDLWMRVMDGITNCPDCSEPDRRIDHDARMVSHPEVKVVAFAHVEDTEPPPGFAPVPARQVVGATEAGEVLSRSM